MHTDAFNNSSKIVNICIYILFILSPVESICKKLLEGFGPHKHCNVTVITSKATKANLSAELTIILFSKPVLILYEQQNLQ